jgi:aspartyl protease family protein
MTDHNPWHRSPTPPPHPARVWLWLGLLIACSVCVWALFHLFPEVSLSDMDTAQLIRLVGILALVSSGVLFGRRTSWGEAARNVAIWVAVAAVLMLGYSFRDVLGEARDRVARELLPAEPVADGAGTVALSESEDGGYYATGEVNGARVRFAIDTGASDIVLAPDDARRAGIDPTTLTYNHATGTANGTGMTADATLDSLALGPIVLDDVRVSVNQRPMATSLLGMAFLQRMKSFEFRGHRLYLRWR